MTPDSEGLHPIANTTSPGITADVVFVHGLIGGSHSTWRHGQEGKDGHFFWPEELGKALPHCAIWSFGYAAGITHWFGEPGMAIQDRARNLVLKLLNRSLGRRPLIFITHSLGGLEVKEIIVRSQTRGSADWKRLVASIRGIVFCGTPHRGSHFATAAKVLSNYLRSQEHLQQMKMGAPELDTLHDEFITWQRNTGTMVESYVEKIGLFRTRRWRRPLPLGLVVPTESGNPGIANCDCHPISADHITLVKPTDQGDVYAGVLRFIAKALTPAVETPPTVLTKAADAIADIGIPGDDQLVSQVLDKDPVITGQALKHLRERSDLLPKIVDFYPSGPVAAEAVRTFLRFYPELSANFLMERLQKVVIREGWDVAARSSLYFDPVHAPFCEGQLYENIKTAGANIELCQLSIEALGLCGHPVGWGSELRNMLGTKYGIEKYGGYVIKALARFFVRTVEKHGMLSLGPCLNLRDELVHLYERPESYRVYMDQYRLDIQQILLHCDGRHADALIAHWLTSESSLVVIFAAICLGCHRIARAVKPLIKILETRSESEVIYNCSCALGQIGTDEAIKRLFATPIGSKESYGLIFALDKIDEPSSFREAVLRLREPASLQFLVLRAIGRKRAREFEAQLSLALDGSNPIDRGTAALALARCDPANKRRFLQALEQANNDIERLLTALAVLTLDRTSYPQLEAQLRRDLNESYLLIELNLHGPAIFSDILEILRETENPKAIELADAWRPFYQHANSVASYV